MRLSVLLIMLRRLADNRDNGHLNTQAALPVLLQTQDSDEERRGSSGGGARGTLKQHRVEWHEDKKELKCVKKAQQTRKAELTALGPGFDH